jgi:hypothetical protein
MPLQETPVVGAVAGQLLTPAHIHFPLTHPQPTDPLP